MNVNSVFHLYSLDFYSYYCKYVQASIEKQIPFDSTRGEQNDITGGESKEFERLSH